MKLIAGLGNPDREYLNTYHNLGFMAADKAAEKLGAEFAKQKCRALIAETRAGNEKVIIAKPLTYMNLSGESVKELLAYYKAGAEDLIVLYDDYDLPKGKLRIRAGGSAGTHNGMRSIIGETGLTAFPRIRVGIRDEEVNIPIINYVLSEVRKDDYELFASVCRKAGEAAAEFARGSSIEAVMNKFNGGDKA